MDQKTCQPDQDLEDAKEIIVVEGRADVINLMRCGIFNTVALEGAKVPDSIKKITKEKPATALLDGDRGGDLILKELMQVTNVKFVGRAPRGKEIEECNCKEIAEAIENKLPIAEAAGVSVPKPVPAPKKVVVPERVKIEVPDTISSSSKSLSWHTRSSTSQRETRINRTSTSKSTSREALASNRR